MIFAELFNNLLGIFTRNDNSKYVLKKAGKDLSTRLPFQSNYSPFKLNQTYHIRPIAVQEMQSL